MSKIWHKKPTLYLDMDECVCDFMSAYYKLEPKVLTAKKFHTMVTDHKIFVDLDWMPNGANLVHELEKLENDVNIEMLTSLGTWTEDVAAEAKRQKTDWLRKKFIRWPANFVNTWADKHKYAHSASILIDDRHDTCRSFRDAGGIAIEYQDEVYPTMLNLIHSAVADVKKRLES